MFSSPSPCFNKHLDDAFFLLLSVQFVRRRRRLCRTGEGPTSVSRYKEAKVAVFYHPETADLRPQVSSPSPRCPRSRQLRFTGHPRCDPRCPQRVGLCTAELLLTVSFAVSTSVASFSRADATWIAPPWYFSSCRAGHYDVCKEEITAEDRFLRLIGTVLELFPRSQEESKMERKRCRVWWPENLSSCAPNSDLFLFGWSFSSANAMDVVVASAAPSKTLLKTKLEEILRSVNRKMPTQLQDISFSVLGFCTAEYSYHQNNDKTLRISGDMQCPGVEEDTHIKVPALERNQHEDQEPSDGRFKMRCGCDKLDQLINSHRQSLVNSCNWMLLLYISQGMSFKKIKWIPQVDHIHMNEQVLSSCDVHLIIYEVPTYGVSHLSSGCWGFPEHVALTVKKPKWLNELEKKPLLPDFVSVMLALNCASSAMRILGQSKSKNGSASKFLFLSMPVSIIWQLAALSLASVSTLIYAFLQLFYMFWRHISRSFFFFIPQMFTHTCKNVHIRSCQFLYWPVFLQGTDLSSNVEYLHRAVLRKHFMWSNLVMDIIFGVLAGVLLLVNVEGLCSWVSVVVRDITDNLLRSGCVWLMGVPAGFKLNNELAVLLGTISLNAIQIFSTFCFTLGLSLKFCIQFLALSGILFGLSVPAALCIDGLKLATFHVSSLHWLISVLYSLQIQALASLWRLFRGRKLNPLRQRLDNYDYTVEQHVVGSLLFTPLLLLLPTTSVFYIFFTCLCITIALICFTLEITISIFHATPYAEILLWTIKRKRFPSGVWFKIVYPDNEIPDGASPEISFERRKRFCFTKGEQGTLISLICSNCATLGEVIGPHYRNIFHGVDPSFIKSMAHGMLSGRRFPCTLHTHLPPTMPWMDMDLRAYWNLCYAAVLSKCSER